MIREFEFEYSRQVEKFLEKNPSVISRPELRERLRKAVLRAMQVEDNNSDVKRLSGKWEGYTRLRIGRLRVIFKYKGHEIVIVTVEELDHRGNVYRGN
jgi:mRNA interferase RelE/StbE